MAGPDTGSGARLPPPPGPYRLGLRRLEFDDGDRRVQAYVWHPATPEPGQAFRPYNWPEETEAFAQAFARLGAPQAADRTLGGLSTWSVDDAPIRPGRYPLVVFNHGGALNPLQNTVLMESLASRGMVVCSLGHAGESSGVAWTDGTMTPISAETLEAMSLSTAAAEAMARFLAESDAPARRLALSAFLAADHGGLAKLSQRWSSDSMALVDRLLAPLPASAFAGLAGNIDPDRLAYIGMSLGGSAAFDSCLADPRATAGVNMDGVNWAFDQIDRVLAIPFLQLYSDPGLRQGLPVEEAVAPGERAGALPMPNDFHYAQDPLRKGQEPAQVILQGVDHMGFTDRALTDTLLSGDLEGARASAMGLITRLVTAFLSWSVLGEKRETFEELFETDPRIRTHRSLP